MTDFDRKVRFSDCTAINETDLALLVNIPTVGEEWVPKSQIDDESEVWENGHSGELVISEWFAYKCHYY